MVTPAQIPCCSPGEVAVLADGTFAGMEVWIREVNPDTGRAVVSLRVYGERERFEVELGRLREPGWKPAELRAPGPHKPRWLRASRYALFTLVCGPLSSALSAARLALSDGLSRREAFTYAEAGFGIGMPVFGVVAAFVFLIVLFAD